MDKEFISGLMVENMKELMKMIKNMDLAFIHGKMVENMKGIGLKENSMEVDNLYKVKKEEKEYGRMAKELNGLKIARMKVKTSKNEIY